MDPVLHVTEWDRVVDLVVVGSGAGGLCAALAARAGGADVLVVEKRDVFGGSTGMSGGTVWVPDNPLMRESGAEDSFSAALEYLEATVGEPGPSASLERKRAFLNAGPEVVSFLRAQGIRLVRSVGYPDYHDELPGGRADGRVLESALFDFRELGPLDAVVTGPRRPVVMYSYEAAALSLMGRTPHSLKTLARVLARTAVAKATGRRLVGGGAGLQAQMVLACFRRDVELWRGSPLLALIADDAAVAGAVVRRHGRDVRVRARLGVLLDTGGFSHSETLRAAHSPTPVGTAWTAANPGDTGEALELATALGAATDLMDHAWWIPASVLPDGRPAFLVWERGKPHSVIVDAHGCRFTNEAASYQDVAQAMLARPDAAVPAWFVMDSRHRARYLWGVTPPRRHTAQWVRDGSFVKAATVTELADRVGLPAGALQETIGRFNGFAERGVDEDFGRGERAYDRYYGDPRVRPNPCLGTLDRPPYYAVALYPGDVGTAGGLLTDVDGRVIRTGGDPFRGLYATGNVTASVVGRAYPGSGTSIAASLVWGFCAAQHALGTNPARKSDW